MTPRAQLILDFLTVLYHNNVSAVTRSARELFSGMLNALIGLYVLAVLSLALFASVDHRWPLVIGLGISIVFALGLLLRTIVITEIIEAIGSWGPYETAKRVRLLVISLVTYLLTFYWLAIVLPFRGQTWVYFCVCFGIYVLLSHLKDWKLVILDYLLWFLFLANLVLIFAVPLGKFMDKHSPWNFVERVETWRLQSLASRRVATDQEFAYQRDLIRCAIIKQHHVDPGAVPITVWRDKVRWQRYRNLNQARWKKLEGDELSHARLKCGAMDRGLRFNKIDGFRTYMDIALKPGTLSAFRLAPSGTDMKCQCHSGGAMSCPTTAMISYGTRSDLRSANEARSCKRLKRYHQRCVSNQRERVIHHSCGGGRWSKRATTRCIKRRKKWCMSYGGRRQKRDSRRCEKAFTDSAGNSTTVGSISTVDLTGKVVMLQSTPDSEGVPPKGIILRCSYTKYPNTDREKRVWLHNVKKNAGK